MNFKFEFYSQHYRFLWVHGSLESSKILNNCIKASQGIKAKSNRVVHHAVQRPSHHERYLSTTRIKQLTKNEGDTLSKDDGSEEKEKISSSSRIMTRYGSGKWHQIPYRGVRVKTWCLRGFIISVRESNTSILFALFVLRLPSDLSLHFFTLSFFFFFTSSIFHLWIRLQWFPIFFLLWWSNCSFKYQQSLCLCLNIDYQRTV